MMNRLITTAVLGLLLLPAFAAEGPPFIENDFAKAVSQAKRMKQPIFVEAWAPW